MAVDIIVPIYNAFEDLRICLDSIYKNTDLQGNRLILINDNSPDERIKPYLDKQSETHGNVIVIHNGSNKGFSANINLGMAQSQDNDVILLNSDTVVTRNWVEKMTACAYSDPAVGTVTPVSNNATLCSVPLFCEENKLPEGLGIEKAAELVERCSFRDYPDITVAHGFCMLVKREVIETIGNFDAETFGRGYGEENDFCNRAEQAGYKHVMCDNTYIYHSGTKSFVSKEKEEYIRQHEQILYQRYPDQMHNNAVHCRDNPNKRIGENVGIYFDLYNEKKNLLLLVQSDFKYGADDNIGGTQLHAHDLVFSLKDKYNMFVVARDGESLAVTAYIGEKVIPFEFSMPKVRDYPLKSDKRIVEFWNQILDAFRIDMIHIHHLYGISFDVLDVADSRNIPVILTLHDFYFVCPTIKLLDSDEQVCIGKESPEKCAQCLGQQMKYIPSVPYIGTWRKRCERYLQMTRKVIVPSENAKNILLQYYPQIRDKLTVIEHGYDKPEKRNVIENPIASKKVIACFESCTKSGGGYCIEGWAYVKDGDCRRTEIWLRITNDRGDQCVIPTTVKFRPDVSIEVKVMNCGFLGYVPVGMCVGKELGVEIFMKTPEAVFSEIKHIHYFEIKELTDKSKLNVAFIGGLNAAKGGERAARIIKKGPQEVSWYVFGGIGVEELQELDKNNLVKTGYYKPQQLPVLLQEHRIDLICILSLWPETYSYTLTEAVLNGIPVIVSNVGALGERTLKHGYGWTVELDHLEDNVVALIEEIIADDSKLAEKRESLKEVSIKSCGDMAGEYYAFYQKEFADDVIRDSFDPRYIYNGYLKANYHENMDETIDIGRRKQLEDAYAELTLLKSSLTYRILIKILNMKIPFRQKIKKLLTRNR